MQSWKYSTVVFLLFCACQKIEDGPTGGEAVAEIGAENLGGAVAAVEKEFTFKVSEHPILDVSAIPGTINVVPSADENVRIKVSGAEEVLSMIKCSQDGSRLIVVGPNGHGGANISQVSGTSSSSIIVDNSGIVLNGRAISAEELRKHGVDLESGSSVSVNGDRVYVNGVDISLLLGGKQRRFPPLVLTLSVPEGSSGEFMDIQKIDSEVNFGDLKLDIAAVSVAEFRTVEDMDLTVAGTASVTIAKANRSKIEIRGSGKVVVDEITGDLETHLSGVTELVVKSFTGNISCDIKGSGDCEISGQFSSVNVEVAGVGSFTSRGAVSGDYTSMASGSGHVDHYGAISGHRRVREQGVGSVTFH